MRILLFVFGVLISCSLLGQNDTTRIKNKEKLDDFEQKNSPFKNNAPGLFKTNPMPILWGPIPFTAEYRLNFESVISRRESIEVGGSYLGESLLFAMIQGAAGPGAVRYNVTGYRFQIAYKIFVSDYFEYGMKSNEQISLTGFYVAAHTSYSQAKLVTGATPARSSSRFVEVSHFNFNFLVGVQENFMEDFFYIDMFAGLGYRHNEAWNVNTIQNTRRPNGDFQEIYLFPRNLKVTLGFNIGFAF